MAVREKSWTLQELKGAVERLDKEKKLKVYSMSEFNEKLLEDHEGVSYEGGDFNRSDRYYYFFDGCVVSLKDHRLYEYYEATLDELTEGAYGEGAYEVEL